MKKSFLNKLGFYTKKELDERLQEEHIRSSNFIKNNHRQHKKRAIENIQAGVDSLFADNPIQSDNWYFSITPFFDKHQQYYFIVIAIPKIESGSTGAFIGVTSFPMGIPYSEGRLDFYIYSEADESKKVIPKMIIIDDFHIFPKDNGIGSYLLSLLDNIGLALRVSGITGKLSCDDLKNRDAQVRFYTRNGYTVNPGDKIHCGSIRKNIMY